MKKIIAFIFSISIHYTSIAQNNPSDNSILLENISQFKFKGDTLNEPYFNELSKLAMLNVKKKEFVKAEILFLEILKKQPDSTFLYNSYLLGNLGAVYQYLHRYVESESFHLKAIELSQKFSNFKPLNYSFALKNLALVYEEQGKFKEAESYFLKWIEIENRELGNKNKDLAESLNYLGEFYFLNKKYTLAKEYFLKSFDITNENSNKKTIEYALILNNLGSLYGELGNYSESESLLLEALKIRVEILGENTEPYLKTLNSLCAVYLKQRDFLKADPLCSKSAKIAEILFSEKSEEFIESLISISNLYIGQGEYYRAETYVLKALEISKEIFGENHLTYAFNLSELATLKYNQGNYSDAEQLFLKTLNIKKKNNGERNLDNIETMNGLASTLIKLKKYSESEVIFLNILDLAKESSGKINVDLPRYKNNLALLYDNLGRFSEAQQLYFEILDIKKKSIGEKSYSYAISLNNLALSYRQQGKYLESEPIFLKSLEIKKDVLGPIHPSYITNLLNLAVLYRIIDSNSKSSDYFQQFIEANQSRLLSDAYNLTEAELVSYVTQRKTEFVSTLSFLKDFPNQFPENNIKSFENEIRIKNLTLRNQVQIKKAIIKSDNNLLKLKYEKLIKNKKQLIKLSDLPLGKSNDQFLILKKETEQLEKDLVQESATFSDFKKSFSFTYDQVRDRLKKNEILIEIASFRYYKSKASDSIFYCAFAVGKNYNSPKFITLFEEKQLSKLMFSSAQPNERSFIEKKYTDKSISDLILKPILKELDGVSTIYLSLAELTHQINFSALNLDEGQTFGEKFQLHILNSPSDILEAKAQNFNREMNLELILYGGIDFDKVEVNSNTEVIKNENQLDFNALSNRSMTNTFGYLIGSKNEVTQIQKNAILNGLKSTLYSDRFASEESIKKLDGKPTPFILHLATHGFFIPRPSSKAKTEQYSSNLYLLDDDPMKRSGLIFSGANKYWGASIEKLSNDDGILTASEISQLDLSKCQLVVLSACETGLGEINGSQGVFGLQRAFKMAGVKNIIMSLWKVPDAQTTELFEIFYEEFLGGKSIHDAFQTAQAKMKGKYSPYYWAGFVFLE
jgi:CHAT domain-containing protein/tetratricopeptide (TPR) repeat protein